MVELPITPTVIKVFNEMFPNKMFHKHTNFFLVERGLEEVEGEEHIYVYVAKISLSKSELLQVLKEKLRGEYYVFENFDFTGIIS